jgi:hypothetical protein
MHEKNYTHVIANIVSHMFDAIWRLLCKLHVSSLLRGPSYFNFNFSCLEVWGKEGE